MNLIDRFRRDETGNVVITFALVLPVVVAGVGAAVSYSSGSAARTSMQNSLDAAVLAAAASSDLTDASSASAIDTASKYFENNVGTFARNSAKEIAATFAVNSLTISGQATGSLANAFGGVIGSKTYAVAVRSSATKSTTPVCVLGLNGLDNGAFDINGNAVFNADCAVQANSNSKAGMSMEGKPTAKAKKFGVVGGHKGDTFSPPPSDGSAKVADPYASLPFPPYSACPAVKGADKKPLEIQTDTTLSPGTYCQGVHINGSSPKVTLQPGIYVMADGPFWTDGGAIVTGDRVMIAFTGDGASLQIWGDSSVTLTSPTSGTYANMQFMQDRDDPNSRGLWDSVGGNTKFKYDGVAYFPTQNFWVFGNSTMNANSPSMAIVADKIWTQGNATVNVTHNNPRNLAVSAGPTTTFGARLTK